jgi:hypothetical protein
MVNWWPQRRFPRQSIALPLLHRSKDATPIRAGAGWTCDLSAAGARIELAEHLDPLEFLHVRLQTDRGSIEGEARVIWAAPPQPGEGGIRHGVAFTQLAPDHLQTLRELLYSMKPWWHAGGRLPVNLPVTCRTHRLPRPPLQGRAGNLSRGGILLRLPKALLPLTDLELTLRRSNDSLTLTGVVVWAEPLERRKTGGLIAHGLRFTGLDWTAAVVLARFLAEPQESLRVSS